MKFLITLGMSALLVCSSSQNAYCVQPDKAAASPVEKALQAADILPKKYTFRVTQIGSDALVQTYARPNAPQTDVKIDAVFIARIVTEKLPDVAKVKVQFFKYDASSYQQVAVTVGDIKAFASGVIPKEKLLQSLDVVRGQTAAGSARHSGVAGGARDNGVAGVGASEGASAGVFNYGRLAFSYPPQWTFVPPKEATSLGEITIPGTQDWAVINIRKQVAPGPEVQAAYDEDYSVKNANTVVRKGPVGVGPRRMPGYQLLTSGYENNQRSKPRLHQHIYFGGGEVYSLTLQYAPADATALNSEFTRVLNTLTLAPPR